MLAICWGLTYYQCKFRVLSPKAASLGGFALDPPSHLCASATPPVAGAPSEAYAEAGSLISVAGIRPIPRPEPFGDHHGSRRKSTCGSLRGSRVFRDVKCTHPRSPLGCASGKFIRILIVWEGVDCP